MAPARKGSTNERSPVRSQSSTPPQKSDSQSSGPEQAIPLQSPLEMGQAPQAGQLRFLQRTAGNQAVLRLIQQTSPPPPPAASGSAGDAPSIQRMPSKGGKKKKKRKKKKRKKGESAPQEQAVELTQAPTQDDPVPQLIPPLAQDRDAPSVPAESEPLLSPTSNQVEPPVSVGAISSSALARPNSEPLFASVPKRDGPPTLARPKSDSASAQVQDESALVDPLSQNFEALLMGGGLGKFDSEQASFERFAKKTSDRAESSYDRFILRHLALMVAVFPVSIGTMIYHDVYKGPQYNKLHQDTGAVAQVRKDLRRQLEQLRGSYDQIQRMQKVLTRYTQKLDAMSHPSNERGRELRDQIDEIRETIAALYQQLRIMLQRVVTTAGERLNTLKDEHHAEFLKFRMGELKSSQELFSTKAGTAKSSKQAKNVVEGEVDERVVHLAAALHGSGVGGKLKRFFTRNRVNHKFGFLGNNDRSFGTVMQWLGGGAGDALRDGYRKATDKSLDDDLAATFGPNSLRTHYLRQLLDRGEPSNYARLALKLGLLSKRILNVGEIEDALEFVEEELAPAELNAIAAKEGPTTDDPFAVAIHHSLKGGRTWYGKQKYRGMRHQLRALAGLKQHRQIRIEDHVLDDLLGPPDLSAMARHDSGDVSKEEEEALTSADFEKASLAQESRHPASIQSGSKLSDIDASSIHPASLPLPDSEVHIHSKPTSATASHSAGQRQGGKQQGSARPPAGPDHAPDSSDEQEEHTHLARAIRLVAHQYKLTDTYAKEIIIQWQWRAHNRVKRTEKFQKARKKLPIDVAGDQLKEYQEEEEAHAHAFHSRSHERNIPSAISGDVTFMSVEDQYLCEVYWRLQKWHGGVDSQALTSAVIEWAQGAPREAREALAAPHSRYHFRRLLDTSARKKGRGLTQAEVDYIWDMVRLKERPTRGREDAQAFDQMMALAKKEGGKSAFNRWRARTDNAGQFKEILFGANGLKDPQRALIQKFGGDLDQWDQGNEQVRLGMFQAAFNQFRAHLREAGLSGAQIQEISDQFQYQGASGSLHQKLVKLAQARYRLNFGRDVLQVVTQLDPGSPEHGLVKSDRALLEILRTRTLGAPPVTKTNKSWWHDIARIVGLAEGDPLREAADDLEVGFFETRRGKAKEKYGNSNRRFKGKLFNKDKIEQLKQSTADLNQDPEYWAALISAEYQKNFLANDLHHVLEIIFEAQRAGVDLSGEGQVAATLKVLDKNAYTWMKRGRWYKPSKHANKLVNQVMGTDTAWNKRYAKGVGTGDQIKLSLKDLIKDSRKSTLLKSRVAIDEITFTVDKLTPEEILQEWYDFAGIKAKAAEKRRLKQEQAQVSQRAEGEKWGNYQARIDLIDQELRIIDIKDELLDVLDMALPPAKALQIKQQVRAKLGAALASQDTEDGEARKAQTLLRYLGSSGEKDFDSSASEEELGHKGFEADFSTIDVNLMGLRSQAISNVELEKQSQTAGTQWGSTSSRQLQRDEASAIMLNRIWSLEKQIAQIDREKRQSQDQQARAQKEGEKQTLVEQLSNADKEFRKAQERWQKTKDLFDSRVEKLITILISSAIFALTMGSGVGAAAGIVQLCWAVASGLMSQIIQESFSHHAQGDAFVPEAGLRTLAALAGSITGMFGAELAFALDVSAMDPIHKGNVATQLFGKPAVGYAKALINSLIGSAGEKAVDYFAHEKNAFARLAPEVAYGLKDWAANAILNAPQAYLHGLLIHGARMKATATGTQSVGNLELGLGYKPSSSAASMTGGSGQDGTFASSDARVGWLGIKDGIPGDNSLEKWFNSMGQFDASPGQKIGRPVWNESGEAHDSALDMFRLFSKTQEGMSDPRVREAVLRGMIWEEIINPQIKKGASAVTGKALENRRMATQDPETLTEESSPKPKSPQPAQRTERSSSPALQLESSPPANGLLVQNLPPQTTMDHLVAAYRADMLQDAWGSEAEATVIADSLGRRLKIHKFNSEREVVSSMAVEVGRQGEQYHLRQVNNNHYEVMVPVAEAYRGPLNSIVISEGQYYRVIGVRGDGHCLFRAIYRARHGRDATLDNIRELRASAMGEAGVTDESIRALVIAILAEGREARGLGPHLLTLLRRLDPRRKAVLIKEQEDRVGKAERARAQARRAREEADLQQALRQSERESGGASGEVIFHTGPRLEEV